MCWRSKKIVKCVAEEDINVFKIVTLYLNGKTKLTSYFFDHVYTLGQTVSSYIELCPNEKKIEKGLHSYDTSCEIGRLSVTPSVLVYDSDKGEENIGIYEQWSYAYLAKMNCVIPKGAVYYRNEYGEYVSDKLTPIDYEML